LVSRYLYNSSYAVALAITLSLVVVLLSAIAPYFSGHGFERARNFVGGAAERANASRSVTCYLYIFSGKKLVRAEYRVPFVVYVLASSPGTLSVNLGLGDSQWTLSVCIEGWGIERACRHISYVSGSQKIRISIPRTGTYIVTVNASPRRLHVFLCNVSLQALYTHSPTSASLVARYAIAVAICAAVSLSVAAYLARKGVGEGFGGWVCGSTLLPFIIIAIVATYVSMCSPITSMVVYSYVSSLPLGSTLYEAPPIQNGIYSALLSIAPSSSVPYIASLAMLSSVIVSLAFASTYESRTELYEALVGLSKRRMFVWKLVTSLTPSILSPVAIYATIVLLTYAGLASYALLPLLRALGAATIMLCIVIIPVCAVSTLISVATKRCFVAITFGGLAGIAMITKLRGFLSDVNNFAISLAWGRCPSLAYEYPPYVPRVVAAMIILAAALYVASYAIFARREL